MFTMIQSVLIILATTAAQHGHGAVLANLIMCSWELVGQVGRNFPLHILQLTLELLVEMEQPGP